MYISGTIHGIYGSYCPFRSTLNQGLASSLGSFTFQTRRTGQGRTLPRMGPGYRMLNLSLLEHRELDTVHGVGGGSIPQIRGWLSRKVDTDVRRLRGSELPQRHDHPTHQHRNKPVEIIQIDQSWVSHYVSRDTLTPCFLCRREIRGSN